MPRPSPARAAARAAVTLLCLTLAPAAPADTDPSGADDADGPPSLPPPPTLPVGEVTVTATRAERGVLEVPGHVTVIEREEIERSGERNVADLLRREAGIFVTNTTASPIGFRVEPRGFNNGGGNGSSLLVLVDGRRVNEPSSSTPDWALLPIDRVERIEVVRGPASAVYGDNAVGGVIQILTRRPEGPPRAELHNRAGTYDLDGTSLVAAGERGPVGATLFVEGRSRDGFRERSDFRTRAADGKLRFTLGDRAALELAAGYSSDDRDFPGALTEAEIDELGRDAADPSSGDNSSAVRTRFVQGRLEVALWPDATLEVLPFYRERDDGGGSSTEFTDFAFDFDNEAEGANLKLQIDRSVAGLPNRLALGFDYLFEEVESDSLFTSSGTFSDAASRAERRIYGLFLQEELELTDDVLVSAGVRFDHARYKAHELRREDFGAGLTVADEDFHETFDLLSPKAALTYRLTETLSAYASFARGFRFPNFDEAFGFFGFNPELRPEKSTAYETGLKLRSERATANLALFHMDVEDEILFNSAIVDPDTGFTTPRNVNFEEIRHRGVEASLSLRPVEWLELHGSYTFDATEIDRDPLTGLDGNRVPILPRHRGSYGARLALPPGVELGLSANLVGSRFVANDLRNEREKLPKHAVYDALLTLRPPLSEWTDLAEGLGLSVRLGVRNVFDREYSEFAGVSSFAPFDVGFFPAPGRNYEVAVAISARRPTR